MMFSFHCAHFGRIATRTVILSNIPFPTTLSILQQLSTPTPSSSISVLGTTTSDGNVMTVYGEDLVYSEFVEGQGFANGNGSVVSISWSTGTYSTPVTEHDIYANCNFDSSTGACTEVFWFSGQSTTQTTSWTGSVVPFQTIEVSVSATETSSSENAARSLKGRQTFGFLTSFAVIMIGTVLL
ncbi:hypothetical protein C8R42DRAFT_11588 [Lentinula raphanica]|nr:hypothetical protein C8R42DRAFT_11588 [Lentinula raphanica]